MFFFAATFRFVFEVLPFLTEDAIPVIYTRPFLTRLAGAAAAAEARVRVAEPL